MGFRAGEIDYVLPDAAFLLHETSLFPSRIGFLLGEIDSPVRDLGSPDGGTGFRAGETGYLLPEAAFLLRETSLPPSWIGFLLGETDSPERETGYRVCAIGHLPHEASRSVHEIAG